MKPSTAGALSNAYAEIVPARCDYRTAEGKEVRSYLAPIVAPYIRSNTEVLDLGCGMGGYSFLVEELGTQPTGIDCSAGAIEAASRIAQEIGSRARFVVGDYTALPFKAESYDLVIFPKNIVECSYDEMERVAAEAHRVLRNGGVFVLTMRDALKTLPAKGTSGQSPWELATGRQSGSVSIPERGRFDYPTYFWTVAFAVYVVGRQLSLLKRESIDSDTEVLVFAKVTKSAASSGMLEPAES